MGCYCGDSIGDLPQSLGAGWQCHDFAVDYHSDDYDVVAIVVVACYCCCSFGSTTN